MNLQHTFLMNYTFKIWLSFNFFIISNFIWEPIQIIVYWKAIFLGTDSYILFDPEINSVFSVLRPYIEN